VAVLGAAPSSQAGCCSRGRAVTPPPYPTSPPLAPSHPPHPAPQHHRLPPRVLEPHVVGGWPAGGQPDVGRQSKGCSVHSRVTCAASTVPYSTPTPHATLPPATGRHYPDGPPELHVRQPAHHRQRDHLQSGKGAPLAHTLSGFCRLLAPLAFGMLHDGCWSCFIHTHFHHPHTQTQHLFPPSPPSTHTHLLHNSKSWRGSRWATT
jgi:hypothetical protein